MTEEELNKEADNHKLILSLMDLTEDMAKDYEATKVYIRNLSQSLESLSSAMKNAGFPDQVVEILQGLGTDARTYSDSMQDLIQKHISALSRFEFTAKEK